jgi:hypothetical protein
MSFAALPRSLDNFVVVPSDFAVFVPVSKAIVRIPHAKYLRVCIYPYRRRPRCNTRNMHVSCLTRTICGAIPTPLSLIISVNISYISNCHGSPIPYVCSSVETSDVLPETQSPISRLPELHKADPLTSEKTYDLRTICLKEAQGQPSTRRTTSRGSTEIPRRLT